MADDESNGTSSGDEDDNNSDASQEAETLIAGRDRRATAGNLMQSLIDQEDEDDLTLLFAENEEEEDVDFAGSDNAASDEQLDSSSDDDDHGPNAQADDDLEGEDELRRESQAQRTKKRKAEAALTTVSGLRKRVKIDTHSISTAPPLRPKKTAEMTLNSSGGPVRASARKQTIENKLVTKTRLLGQLEKRAKINAQMKKADQERDKQRPKEMTQADRLAEAKKTEKRNSKSLNRWEETERKRADEQAAKLAALKDRKLAGPVVSWWSGMATWVGTKLIKLGTKDTDQEMLVEFRKRGRRPKNYVDASDATREDAASTISTPRGETTTPVPLEALPSQPLPILSQAPQPSQNIGPVQVETKITFTEPQGPENFFLQGIHEYASMLGEKNSHDSSKPPSTGPATPPVRNLPGHPSTAPVQVPPVPPQPSFSTRSIVVLSNFESVAPADRGEFGVFYNPRKVSKPNKVTKVNPELCPITSLPVRYRDPTTAITYANSTAYKKLKELQDNKFVWSAMLGSYVGEAGVVARGVPDGFLAPVDDP